MKYLMLLLVIGTAQADVMIGYEHVGFEIKSAEAHLAPQYIFVGQSIQLKKIDVGFGYGLFENRFESTQPALGEIEGFRSESTKDASFGLFARYKKNHFYIQGLVAKPTFETRKSRVQFRQFNRTTPPQNGSPGVDIFDLIYEERNETEDSVQLYLTVGFVF